MFLQRIGKIKQHVTKLSRK